jgi:hypothetical protein
MHEAVDHRRDGDLVAEGLSAPYPNHRHGGTGGSQRRRHAVQLGDLRKISEGSPRDPPEISEKSPNKPRNCERSEGTPNCLDTSRALGPAPARPGRRRSRTCATTLRIPGGRCQRKSFWVGHRPCRRSKPAMAESPEGRLLTASVILMPFPGALTMQFSAGKGLAASYQEMEGAGASKCRRER